MNNNLYYRLITSILIVALMFASNACLGQSRVVIAEDAPPPIDDAIKKAILDSLCPAIDTVYVFPEVAKEIQAFVRKQMKDGAYDQITDLEEFTQKLTEDFRSICNDGHFRVYPINPADFAEQDTLSEEERRKRYLEEGRNENFGFQKLERLQGNIGYMRFDRFNDAGTAGATAIAAMNFLAYCDALIIDLRQNGGGSPSMIQLISSYFFEEPVHLNSFYIRALDTMKQFWSQAYVQGEKMTNVPIYVLTSRRTFSGAEEFTYNLKNMERATIVGETTGGGAHPVGGHTFAGVNVGMSLPFGRAVNPITGTNWEGTGVEPHISVPANEALNVAFGDALKKMIESEVDELKRYSLEWTIRGLEVKRNPVHLESSELEKYVGTYGPRRLWLESGSLHYQREDGPIYRLVPMGGDMFMINELDYFRIKFVAGSNGQIDELIGLYDNGHRDNHKRSGD
jgi:hypothetical protein